MGVLVVDQVIHCLHVIVVSISTVFLAESILYHHAELVMRAENSRARIHSETSRVHSQSLVAESALFGGAVRQNKLRTGFQLISLMILPIS